MPLVTRLAQLVKMVTESRKGMRAEVAGPVEVQAWICTSLVLPHSTGQSKSQAAQSKGEEPQGTAATVTIYPNLDLVVAFSSGKGFFRFHSGIWCSFKIRLNTKHDILALESGSGHLHPEGRSHEPAP